MVGLRASPTTTAGRPQAHAHTSGSYWHRAPLRTRTQSHGAPHDAARAHVTACRAMTRGSHAPPPNLCVDLSRALTDAARAHRAPRARIRSLRSLRARGQRWKRGRARGTPTLGNARLGCVCCACSFDWCCAACLVWYSRPLHRLSSLSLSSAPLGSVPLRFHQPSDLVHQGLAYLLCDPSGQRLRARAHAYVMCNTYRTCICLCKHCVGLCGDMAGEQPHRITLPACITPWDQHITPWSTVTLCPVLAATITPQGISMSELVQRLTKLAFDASMDKHRTTPYSKVRLHCLASPNSTCSCLDLACELTRTSPRCFTRRNRHPGSERTQAQMAQLLHAAARCA